MFVSYFVKIIKHTLDFIKQFGQISLKEALEIVQLPERTVQRRLSSLVKIDLLSKIGEGKNTKYIFKTR